ncbi:MAG: amino acid ABC transporter permease [Gaiellaceae bacterium]
MATRVDTLEPMPAPELPPERHLSPKEWAQKNLFASRLDTILTIAFGLVVAWLVYRLGKFVFFDARWEIIERNITNLMVSRFPRDELWRVWAALLVLGPSLGFGAGTASAARRREVAEGRALPPERASALRRAGPALLLVAVLLWFAQSFEATLLTVAVGALGVGGYFLGRRIALDGRKSALVVLVGIAVAFLIVTAFGGVGWQDWGGFMLTIFLAVGGILLAFPFGVLLALGRRSSLPAVRMVCIAYIELFRGVPLIAVLFMGAFMIGFLLPPGVQQPSLVTRALIALVLFTAAYVAEIVRGGLQSVPVGQVEAAQALGLSPWRITVRIVLPQALRTVIPGLVGQFISLFKDTSLVAIIGLTELLNVSRNITTQPDFLAQGLIVETLVFAAFVYWTGAYWMSRESQRLERRLGLGER